MSRLRNSDKEWLAFCGLSVGLIDWLDHANRTPAHWWLVLPVLMLALAIRKRR